jgi:hypothetical protein
MPTEGPSDQAVAMEKVRLACDVIERRLRRLEAEMTTPGPASLSRKDNGDDDPVPVAGGYQSPTDPRDYYSR